MNGAQAVVRTLVGSGMTTCFANPGTSEMHFLAALDVQCRRCAVCCACSKGWRLAPQMALAA